MLLMSEDCLCLIEESPDAVLIPSLLILLIDVKFQMFGALFARCGACFLVVALAAFICCIWRWHWHRRRHRRVKQPNTYSVADWKLRRPPYDRY